jgi:hypothetical protein
MMTWQEESFALFYDQWPFCEDTFLNTFLGILNGMLAISGATLRGDQLVYFHLSTRP